MSIGRCGLTFVELLIAATMIAILFVGLGGHLRGGIRVWQQATTNMEALQRERVALNRLERDLTNAILYDPQDQTELLEPQFSADQMLWVTVERTSQESPGSVQVISYACGEIESTKGLLRTSQPIQEALSLGDYEPKQTIALSDCEELSFEYAYESTPDAPLVWQATWDDPMLLPRLVRMRLKRTKSQDIERVMMIPSGEIAGP